MATVEPTKGLSRALYRRRWMFLGRLWLSMRIMTTISLLERIGSIMPIGLLIVARSMPSWRGYKPIRRGSQWNYKTLEGALPLWSRRCRWVASIVTLVACNCICINTLEHIDLEWKEKIC